MISKEQYIAIKKKYLDLKADVLKGLTCFADDNNVPSCEINDKMTVCRQTKDDNDNYANYKCEQDGDARHLYHCNEIEKRDDNDWYCDLDTPGIFSYNQFKHLQPLSGFKSMAEAAELSAKVKSETDQYIANLKELRFIAGSLGIAILKKDDRLIVMFSSDHKRSTKFICPSSATVDGFTLHVHQYLEKVFREHRDIIFDLFIEMELTASRQTALARRHDGLFQSVLLQWANCFYDLKNREECVNQVPNVRFHLIDVRETFSGDPEFNLFLKESDDIIIIMSQLFSLQNDCFDFGRCFKDPIKYDPNENRLKIIAELKELHKGDTIIQILDGTKKATMIEYIKEMHQLTGLPADLNELLITYEIYMLLLNLSTDFILKVIRNDTGYYNNIGDKFWQLFENSGLLAKNMGNLKPELKRFVIDYINDSYVPYWKEQSENSFDLITGKLVEYSKMRFYDDGKSINHEQLMVFPREYVDHWQGLFFPWSALVVDVYTLGRMFKKFEQRAIPRVGEIYQDRSKNIIAIAGATHVSNYYNFLTRYLGFQPIFDAYYPGFDGEFKCIGLPPDFERFVNSLWIK